MSCKLTQENIKELAYRIYLWLEEHDMSDALCIYYGTERISTYEGKAIIETEYNGKPIYAKDFCGYAPYDNIITISSEGLLYDYYDMYYDMPKELETLWEQQGLYCEANEPWNWSLAVNDEDLEIEYPKRAPKPEPPMYIFKGCRERLGKEYPKELDTVMDLWYDLGQLVGDEGSCVIGQNMSFIYKGVNYEMCPITGFQGEYAHVKWVDVIKKLLETMGATDINWNCGRLD